MGISGEEVLSEVMSVGGCAERAGVSQKTVREWRDRGLLVRGEGSVWERAKLSAYLHPDFGWMILRDDLELYLREVVNQRRGAGGVRGQRRRVRGGWKKDGDGDGGGSRIRDNVS